MTAVISLSAKSNWIAAAIAIAPHSFPQQLGIGYERIIQLRGDLTISILSTQLWQPLTLKRQHEDTFPITAKFYLSDAFRVKTPQVPEIEADYTELKGYSYLYHLPELTEAEELRSDEPIQVVMIYASVDYFRALSPANGVLPRPLHRLMQGTGLFHQSLGKMTLTMTQVLRQILHCRYQSDTQQLYLESKALELLALQFACLEADSPAPRQFTLKASALERVQYAKEILVQRLNSPPSLIELAHQVGLSDRKLKQGFRYLFGTTVFGYLCDYRMEQAQNLLHHPHITVAQVATQVGYRNPEAFSTAFRRKFSVSPKAYQLGQRG